MKKYFVSISLILCSFTTFAAVNCEGEIKNQSIREDIKVKKNCQLEGLIIHGNVILENGASVELHENHIKGNIESNKNFTKIIANHNNISGNVDFATGKNIQLLNNQISGDLKLKKNNGNIVVNNNEIAGNLICLENAFSINGSNNQVKGNKSEQCRSF